MLRHALAMFAVLTFTAPAWGQDWDAAQDAPVPGSRVVILDTSDHILLGARDLDAFGFTPLAQISERDVVRASMNDELGGPWIALSLERAATGEAFLSTSVVVGVPRWRRRPRSGDDRPVIRTARLDEATANQLFAAARASVESTPEPSGWGRFCSDRQLEVRMAEQETMALRCDEPDVRLITRDLFRAAEALQPDCAPLPRIEDATHLAFCHIISGEIRAGSEAAVVSEELANYAIDPSALRRDSLIDPGVRVSWMDGRIARSPAALMHLLGKIKTDQAHRWSHGYEEIVGRSRDSVIIRGYLRRETPTGADPMRAPYEQVWKRDRSLGWRLTSWDVKPLSE